MCFIILNDFYMAHHNSLGICRQLKIRHLYGTFNSSTQCSVFLWGPEACLSTAFCRFRLWFLWKGRALYEGKSYLR